MTETAKKARTATTNEFQIAANIEKWFARLRPADQEWVLLKLNKKYGRSTEDAGPDRIPRRDTD